MQIKGIRGIGETYRQIRPWRALEFSNGTIAEDPDEPDVGVITLGFPLDLGNKLDGMVLDVMNDFDATGAGVISDTPMIQAAIDAASTAGGGIVWFPQPSVRYKISTSLVPKSNVRLLGPGVRSATMKPILRSDIGVHMFAPAALVEGFEVEGLKLHAQVGSGHLFNIGVQTIGEWKIHNCTLLQEEDDASVMSMSAGIIVEVFIEDNFIQHTLTATVPTFNLITDDNAVNIFKFLKNRVTYSGNYTLWIESTSGTGYAQDIFIEDNNFEICLGGEVKLLSCRSVTMRGIPGYDGQEEGDYVLDRVYIGASATGLLDSRAIKLDQVTRRGGTLDTGVYDIHLAAGEVVESLLIQCNGEINLGSNNVTVICPDSSSPATNYTGEGKATIIDNGVVTTGGVLLDADITSEAKVMFLDGGTGFWQLYKNDGSGPLLFRDLTNNRTHIQLTAGANSEAALTAFSSDVSVAGGLTVTGATTLTGNSTVAGTFGVGGDLECNVDCNVTGDINVNGGLVVAGNVDFTDLFTAIPDASGGVTTDTEARAALNGLLAQLRTKNWLAT